MSRQETSIRWGRLAAVVAALVLIYLIGQYLADLVVQQFDLVMHVRSEPTFHRMIMLSSAIYIVLMGIPFMPGAEIGISMILLLGPKICFLVYVSTVAALIPPYLMGRLIPARYCVRFFQFVGLTRARKLMEQIQPLSRSERQAYLLANAPTRFGPFFVRHRYLALAVLLNVPGNIVIGGGGGIALVAGLSGLYSVPRYCFTIALAVAPVPLVIALTGLGS